ncbi:MAG: hypothetical protein OK456_08215 [Thaumarchaeota archaeon]|nr:hypothetical protein [Nitrososphaerota archaeon]
MSVDVPGAINAVSTLVVMGILVVGIYRALEMRRAFVRGAYRSRATWSTLLMLVIILTMVENFVNVPDTGLLSLLGFIPFIALILVIFAYADRSVLVAIETDFFHRDTLGWLRVRWPVAILLVGMIGAEIVGGVVLTPAQQNSFLGDVLNDLFFGSLVPILGYATAALIVGARRSADRTLRRSILLLGLALSTLVFSIVVTTPFVGYAPLRDSEPGHGRGGHLPHLQVRDVPVAPRPRREESRRCTCGGYCVTRSSVRLK